MRLLRTHHLVHPANVLLEHLLVQKHQGTQRLALCRGGNMACHGQMRRELLHFLGAHVAWMPFAMEENEAFHPAQIGFFGP